MGILTRPAALSAGVPDSLARRIAWRALVESCGAHLAAGERDGTALAGLMIEPANVLVDATAWPRWFGRLLAPGREATLREAFFRRWTDDYLPAVLRGWRDRGEALSACLVSLGLSRGHAEELAAAGARRFGELAQAARPLPGAVRTIDRLREAGLKLAFVGDCEEPGTVLAERLTQMRLGTTDDLVVTSCDLEASKPAAAIYEAAALGLGLSVVELAFVGNSPGELLGAVAVGLRTIATAHAPGALADVYLSSIAQLGALVVDAHGEAG